jgi:cytochrome c oxidase subunit 4
MAAGHGDTSVYIKVFWWLFGLTIAEIALVFLPIAKLAINMSLVVLALAKASLVALYFMHLRSERRAMAVLALTPLLLGALLVFALLPDLTAVAHHSEPTAAHAEAAAH